MKRIRFTFKPSRGTSTELPADPSLSAGAKRKKHIPSKVWFWVHKILLVVYTSLLYRHISGLIDDHIWNRGNNFDSSQYKPGLLYLNEVYDYLDRITKIGELLSALFAVIIAVSVISLLSFRREVTDIDRKRNIWKDPRTLIDIVLNIGAAVMVFNTASAGCYTFLSTGKEDSTLSAKRSLMRSIEYDIGEEYYYLYHADKNTRSRFGVLKNVSVPLSEVTVNETDTEYRKADLSYYDWGIRLPGGNEFSIWYQPDYPSYENHYQWQGLYMDIGSPRTVALPFYTLNIGDKIYPLTENIYSQIKRDIGKFENDDTAIMEILYYPNSELLGDFRIVGKDNRTDWKTVKAADDEG